MVIVRVGERAPPLWIGSRPQIWEARWGSISTPHLRRKKTSSQTTTVTKGGSVSWYPSPAFRQIRSSKTPIAIVIITAFAIADGLARLAIFTTLDFVDLGNANDTATRSSPTPFARSLL
jgi:hypothetical protein